MNDPVIHIKTSAFYMIINEVVAHVIENSKAIHEPVWIDTEAAMKLLNITSRTTLLQLRSRGKIAYSQPMKKIILYNRPSILTYIESHVRPTF